MSTLGLPDRPPIEEMGKRAAEAGGGLAAAAKGIATQNFMANQSAHRRRVEDSHRLGMKALGMTDDEFSKPEDEDVGDLTVTGDVYGDEAIRMLKSTPEQPSPPNPKSSVWETAAPLLLAGALGAMGVGLPWLFASLGGAAVEQIVDTDTDTQYLLELVPGDS
jgi:hypothetical protein